MAKIKDYNLIAETAGAIIDESCPDLTARIGREQAIFCVMAIYTNNDVVKGYGQDFFPLTANDENDAIGKVSVIAFETGISVIESGHASRYQDRFSMCGYESLEDDLTQICICIQAAFDRINANL